MILVYDTETTGLPDFKVRSSDPSQSHIVQLALLLLDDEGREIKAESMIVKPDGWTIPPETTAIHGISQERAMDEGVHESDAVTAFLLMQGAAAIRVAHNESFDRRIMRIALTRLAMERDFIAAIEARPSYCTCNAATPIVKLPPTERMLNASFTGPKPPKLEECMRHFFGEDLPGAHDAPVDARACARLYLHLKSIGAA